MDLLHHLSYFVAVADEGHFGRAAERLGVTQPPVSKGVRRLEEHLGLELIHRTPRGADVTAAGAALLERARLLVDDAERFTGLARDIAAFDTVSRVGLATDLDSTLAAVAATAVLGAHTVSAAPTELVRQLRAGVLDVAVLPHPCVTDALHVGPTMRIPAYFVVPADADAAAVAGLPLAVPPRRDNPVGRDDLLDELRGRGLDPGILEIPSAAAALAAVSAGRAVTVTTDAAACTLPGVRAESLRGGALRQRIRTARRDRDHDISRLESALWKHSRERLRT